MQRKSKKASAAGLERVVLMGNASGEVYARDRLQEILKVLVRNFDIFSRAVGSYPRFLSVYVT